MAIKHQLWDPEAKKADPCPFQICAGKPTKLRLLQIDERDRSPDRGKRWVYCANCGASGPHRDSDEEAVQAWNERLPRPTAPPARSPLGKALLLLALLGILTGCSAAADPSKIEITIENRTEQPVYGMLFTGSPFFPMSLTLLPHESKGFVVLREFMPGSVRLVVIERKGDR